MNAGKLSR
jgi:hypothetical protein